LYKIENKYTILCVDDNQNNLFTLRALLETTGEVNTFEALSAKEGLNILLKKKVDLILLDVQMPEMNGFEFAKLVKLNKRTRDIPIIFVTAVFKSEEFIKEGFELGAVDYLTKPIDDHQLLNKISLYLKLFSQNIKLKQSEKKFIDIAQSIGDGIYTLDLENKTTFVNQQALSMLGFKEKELLGKHIHQYIHYKTIENEMIEASDCPIHKVATEKNIFTNVSMHFIKKDGSFLSVSVLATPIYDEKSIVGTVVVFRDKTQEAKIDALEKEREKNQEQIIHSMVNMIEARDSYTAGHTKRVAEYCVLIAQEMEYSKEEIETLRKAAWLHDIGKISTPDSVLLKPGKLTAMEYELIQDHLISGYNLLHEIDQYKDIAEIMREHHEKFDGSGYPRGIKKDEINPLSRIMIVADAFDAMTTNRVYKPRKSLEVALAELESLSAKHFHPEVVSAAVKALKDIDIDKGITQLPQSTIEQQRFSYFYKDRLTELFIIEYLPLIIRYRIESDAVYFYSLELHNFSQYNKNMGWKEGDKFLIAFAKYIDRLDADSILFRVEGDDFLILSEKKLENIASDVQKFPLFKESLVSCSVSEKFISDFESLENIQEFLTK
jgi:PAS domain S-box-containing protein/putative nucleotidyltransferase with HDIG domain